MKSCGILIAESPAEIGKTLYDKLARWFYQFYNNCYIIYL
jgi:hypothetical protein